MVCFCLPSAPPMDASPARHVGNLGIASSWKLNEKNTEVTEVLAVDSGLSFIGFAW